MKTWSMPFGSLWGTELRLHFSFLFLLVFVFFTEPGVDLHPARGLALVLLITASVLLHEVGHIMMARTRNFSLRGIMLLPIGGVHMRDGSEMDRRPNPADEMFVALAGPPMNLIAAGVGVFIAYSIKPGMVLWGQGQPLIAVDNLVKSFIWINVVLAVVNLLPAYPLDGGRVLRAFIADPIEKDPKGISYRAATRKAVMIGQVFAMFLIFAGVRNTWLMLIGFFLFVAVQIEDRSLLFQSVIENVKLEEIMLTDFSTLSPADTLEDALNKAVHSLQDDFPVIRDADMVGVISKNHILRALREDGNGYVQSAMKKAFETATRGETLAGAFRKITKGVTMIPVVDDERLVGIVTLQNLMHSMSVLAESRKLSREQE
jgi:Zn-dependent protease/CBS domain-containing protein